MAFTRYKARETSLEVESWIGTAFYIRAYCDDTTNGATHVTKPGVVKLKLTPLVQFVNTNIAWDISNSSHATGTIDTFDINWGGTTDIGNLAAQDWSSDPKTGNVQYTATGTYTVTASATDTLGTKTKVQNIEVRIVSFVNVQRCYIATIDGGVFILTPGGGDPAAANTGLTGNYLNVRSMRLHPAYKALPVGQQHIWLATESGVAYTIDGAASWNLISEATLGTPTNTAADGTPPTASDPDNIDIAFDPQDPGRVYLLRATATRAWIYYTDDYGATWSNTQVSR